MRNYILGVVSGFAISISFYSLFLHKQHVGGRIQEKYSIPSHEETEVYRVNTLLAPKHLMRPERFYFLIDNNGKRFTADVSKEKFENSQVGEQYEFEY